MVNLTIVLRSIVSYLEGKFVFLKLDTITEHLKIRTKNLLTLLFRKF